MSSTLWSATVTAPTKSGNELSVKSEPSSVVLPMPSTVPLVTVRWRRRYDWSGGLAVPSETSLPVNETEPL